jgi:large subunit ribosomal protein L35
MPSLKLKTHKGSKKRFKVSATGKVMHKACGSSHINSHKSGKKIRQLRKKRALKSGADAARYRRAMRTGVRAPWRAGNKPETAGASTGTVAAAADPAGSAADQTAS